jgi:copper chaperone CopZ
MESKKLSLEIGGMTCVRCGDAVQQGLLALRGVLAADVEWEAGTALVAYDPQAVRGEDIIKAAIFSQDRVVQNDKRVIRHRYTAVVRD